MKCSHFLRLLLIGMVLNAQSLFAIEKNSEQTSDALPLSLNQAIKLTLLESPELEASRLEALATQGRLIQAGLLSNPELSLELENFAGSDHFQNLDSAERTIEISQPIKLGFKRNKEKQAVSLELRLAWLDYQSKRSDVIAEVKKDFTEALVAQERYALAQDLTKLSEAVLNSVSERVKAGKVSPLEKIKAEVSLAKIRMEQEKAERRLHTSQKRLASHWTTLRKFKLTQGGLKKIKSFPSYPELVKSIHKNPDFKRWSVEIEHRKALMNLERSKKWPDLSLGGGFRYFDETDDHAFLGKLSLPLPFFERNQGSILEAEKRWIKAKQEKRSALLRIKISLAEAYQELSNALTEITVLEKEVLPGAEQVFNAAREGYQQGKLSYLDVLDAQKTLFESKVEHLEALASYHKAAADIERLLGGHPSLIQKTSEKNQRSLS